MSRALEAATAVVLAVPAVAVATVAALPAAVAAALWLGVQAVLPTPQPVEVP